MERKWAHKTEIRQERWHIKKAEHYGRFLHIRLIVLLNTGNLVMFYQNVYCFFKLWFWIRQYDPFHMFHTIIDKFYLLFKNFVVPGSCLHEFEIC